MNPEIFQDPQKFLWPYVYAKEAQKQLEEKQIEVEDNFAMTQAIMGWLIDNPWFFLLFMQREVQRLDVPINGVAKTEIERCKRECEQFVQQIESIKVDMQNLEEQIAEKEKEKTKLVNDTVLAIWENLKSKVVCDADKVFVSEQGDLIFENLFDPDTAPVADNPPHQSGKVSLLDYLKREVFNVEGINVSQLLNNCPPSQQKGKEDDPKEAIQQPEVAKKETNKKRTGN
jgi:hypothetical protein